MTDDQSTSAQNAETEREFLSFKVGNEDYSIPIKLVREIRSWSQATPLPHTPAYMRGVINLRGAVLPIIDLAKRLNCAADTHTERSVVIVVEHQKKSLGLLVSAVSDILTMPLNAIAPAPTSGASETSRFLEAIAIVDDKITRILNLEDMLPTRHDVIISGQDSLA